MEYSETMKTESEKYLRHLAEAEKSRELYDVMGGRRIRQNTLEKLRVRATTVATEIKKLESAPATDAARLQRLRTIQQNILSTLERAR